MNPNVYARPNKPATMVVKQRTEPDEVKPAELAKPVTVDRSTECHVTPADVAERMADYADVRGLRVLEPSAGTGSLVHAVAMAGAEQVTAIERSVELHSTLINRFGYLDHDCYIVRDCFLDYASKTDARFDRIVMNPPFRKARQHVEAARQILSDDGLIVALVPITFKTGDTIEELPNDTFTLAKVNTKIIEISC